MSITDEAKLSSMFSHLIKSYECWFSELTVLFGITNVSRSTGKQVIKFRKLSLHIKAFKNSVLMKNNSGIYTLIRLYTKAKMT